MREILHHNSKRNTVFTGGKNESKRGETEKRVQDYSGTIIQCILKGDNANHKRKKGDGGLRWGGSTRFLNRNIDASVVGTGAS